MKVNYKKLIIGTGFIAQNFKKYSNYLRKNNMIVYAAGISKSTEENTANLKKEIRRFEKFCKFNDKRVIYISTYSIGDKQRSNKKYVKNKIKIEKIIKKKLTDFLIIRLPEIVGSNNNQNTLTNFFYNNISKNLPFFIYKNTKRNLIDIDDAILKCIQITKKIKTQNKTVNLLNEKFYTPLQIANTFEKILKKNAIYKIKKIAYSKWTLRNNFYLKTKKNYLKKILNKYYN